MNIPENLCEVQRIMLNEIEISELDGNPPLSEAAKQERKTFLKSATISPPLASLELVLNRVASHLKTNLQPDEAALNTLKLVKAAQSDLAYFLKEAFMQDPIGPLERLRKLIERSDK